MAAKLLIATRTPRRHIAARSCAPGPHRVCFTRAKSATHGGVELELDGLHEAESWVYDQKLVEERGAAGGAEVDGNAKGWD